MTLAPKPVENAGVRCEVHLNCAICRQPGLVVHSGLQDHIFGVPGSWGLRRCTGRRCGLIWLDPMPLPEETGKFYGNYYTHSGSEAELPVPGIQRKGWKPRLKRALAHALFWRKHAFLSELSYLEGMSPGRMLEVGCGNGRFLGEAAAAGWQAVGIDFDVAAINAARKIPGVDARVGDLVNAGFGEGEFDAIVMNNVIEHLPQPERVLVESRRILKRGGRLVLVTPNSRSLGYRHYGQDWRGLEIPRHLFIYSPATLAALARTAGFGRSAVFSSAGASVGVEMILFSQALRDRRLQREPTVDDVSARRVIKEEIASVLLGRDVGEWAVLVAHK